MMPDEPPLPLSERVELMTAAMAEPGFDPTNNPGHLERVLQLVGFSSEHARRAVRAISDANFARRADVHAGLTPRAQRKLGES